MGIRQTEGWPSPLNQPDRKRIVHVERQHMDDTVRIWEMSTGALLAELPGHGGYVSSVDAAGRGLKVLSGGHDGRVRAWSLGDGPEDSPENQLERVANTAGLVLGPEQAAGIPAHAWVNGIDDVGTEGTVQ